MDSLLSKTMANLRRASSSYDVIAILFQAVTTSDEQKNLRLHSLWRKTRLHGAELSKIIQLLFSHPEGDFHLILRELISFYEENGEDAIPLMVETLFCFDNELSGMPPPRQCTGLVNHGPLNSAQCQELTNAYVYLLPKDAPQNRFLREYGLRRGGKLLTCHPSGLQRKLESYTVIPKDRLGALAPQVWAYYPGKAVQTALRSGPLRIAVFSFGNRLWFSALPTPSGEEFDIRYTPAQEAAIVQAYQCALVLAEEHEADIVVFPELALGASARQSIRNYLRSTSLARRHVKLIFAGTEWVNGKNTAYIFSAGGVPLLTQKKREPFDLHDKKTGVTRRENLADHENLLMFLDVAGLGRVAYTVCRDFLDPGENMIRSDLLGCSLLIASCFTGELSPFFTVADGLAKQYGVVTLAVNSCAAIQMKTPLDSYPPVGFLSVPTCDERKRLGCDVTSYTIHAASCASGNCALCPCLDLYTLHYPQQAPKELGVYHEKF